METQFLVNGIAMGSLYALPALGVAFIFGVTRTLHFAQVSVFTIAGYCLYVGIALLGWPEWLAVLLALVLAVLVGITIEWFIYRPLRRDRVQPKILFMASFAVLITVENVLALFFGRENKALTEDLSVPVASFFGAVLTTRDLAAIFAAAVILLLSWAYLRYSSTGIMLRALADNPQMARIIGLNVDRLYVLTFAIGSAMTVPAVFAMAASTGVSPNIGMNPVMYAFVAVIAGGIGSMAGAVLLALFIGIMENVAVIFLDSSMQSLIVYAFLFVVLAVRPTGLLGTKATREV